MIGEHARIRGEIRTKSVNVRGTVEGNIFVTERCELEAGSTVCGDIEAPRLMVNENVTFLAAQRSGRGSHSQRLTFACRAKRDQQRNRLRKVLQPITQCGDLRLR